MEERTVWPAGACAAMVRMASSPPGAPVAEKSYMRGPRVTAPVFPSTTSTDADVPLTAIRSVRCLSSGGTCSRSVSIALSQTSALCSEYLNSPA